MRGLKRAITTAPESMLRLVALIELTALCAWFCPAAASAQSATSDAASLERSVRHTQAHSDRVLLAPTAETHPKGTLFATTYDIVVAQIGYAFSDRLHASVTGLINGRFIDVTLKANVLRSRHARVAAFSSIAYAFGEPNDGDDDSGDPDATTELVSGRAGGVLQLCFELRCRSSLSTSGMLVIHEHTELLLPVGVSAGLTGFVVDEVSLLLEYSSILNAARDLELLDLPVHVIAYGARVSGNEHWALDLALIRSLDSDAGILLEAPRVFDFLGLPLIAFTYRFAP